MTRKKDPDKPGKVVSLSGAPLHEHTDDDRGWLEAMHTPAAPADPAFAAEVREHVERHVGPVAGSFTSRIPGQAHLVIHHVAPSERLPFDVYVTNGMSAQPMSGPDGKPLFAELVLIRSPGWSDKLSWPIVELRKLALLPRQHDTHLWVGHSLDHEGRYHPTTELSAVVLGDAVHLGVAFAKLQRSDGAAVRFLATYFLFPEELQHKMRAGADALFDHLVAHGVGDVLEPVRANTCVPMGELPEAAIPESDPLLAVLRAVEEVAASELTGGARVRAMVDRMRFLAPAWDASTSASTVLVLGEMGSPVEAMIRAALACARVAQEACPSEDPAVLEGQATLLRWLNGEATEGDVQAASDALYARRDADTPDRLTAWATYCACRVGRSAAATPWYHASAAAGSAEAAVRVAGGEDAARVVTEAVRAHLRCPSLWRIVVAFLDEEFSLPP